MSRYLPQKGDLIILTFDPQAEHEQMGRRPALVISNSAFNKAVGLAVVCPITSTRRDFPFHVALDDAALGGYVMCEQIKSIDFTARQAKFVAKASDALLGEVLGIVESVVF